MPELTDPIDLKQKIYTEARSRVPVPPGEDEITSNMLAKETGCTVKQARTILADMAEDGIITVRMNGVENGKTCKIYRYESDK